jgi:hypothetical protein
MSEALIDDTLEKLGFMNGELSDSALTANTMKLIQKQGEESFFGDKLEYQSDFFYNQKHAFTLKANVARFVKISID